MTRPTNFPPGRLPPAIPWAPPIIRRSRFWILSAVLVTCGCTSPGVHPSPSAADLHWVVDGSGPPVVLLGGGGMDLRQWDETTADLARDHRVVRFDHRGWGRSPAGATPYSRIQDIRSVLEMAGIDRAILVGSSFGGGLALDFALAYPEKVRGLVLVGSELSGYEWSPAFIERGSRIAMADSATRIDLLLADPHFLPRARGDTALHARAHRLLSDNLHRLFALDYSLVEPPAALAITQLERVTVPVLVVTPELDHPDLFAIADTLGRRLPRVQARIFAGAGHLVHMEQPEAFAALVRGFVEGLDGP